MESREYKKRTRDLKKFCDVISYQKDLILTKKNQIQNQGKCLELYVKQLQSARAEILPFVSSVSYEAVDNLISVQNGSKMVGEFTLTGLKQGFMQYCKMQSFGVGELAAQTCGALVTPVEVILKNYIRHNGRFNVEKIPRELGNAFGEHAVSILLGGVPVDPNVKEIIVESIIGSISKALYADIPKKCSDSSLCVVKELATIIPEAL